jgi:hypothetical protein
LDKTVNVKSLSVHGVLPTVPPPLKLESPVKVNCKLPMSHVVPSTVERLPLAHATGLRDTGLAAMAKPRTQLVVITSDFRFILFLGSVEQ